MSAKLVFWFLGLLLLVLYVWPGVDVEVSEYFYRPELGGLYLKNNLAVQLLHKSAAWIYGIFVVLAGVYGGMKLYQVRSLHWKHYKKLLYILIVAGLGAGLLVHIVIKDVVGRPRPLEVVEFGGAQQFQRVFSGHRVCTHDCAFPSGHAAAGFLFFALAFLSTGVWRGAWFMVGMMCGFAIGFARIAEGGHFLSDVVGSGLVMYIIAYLTERILKPNVVVKRVR